MENKFLQLSVSFLILGILSFVVNQITNIKGENIPQKSKYPEQQKVLIKAKSKNLFFLGYTLIILGIIFLIIFLISSIYFFTETPIK